MTPKPRKELDGLSPYESFDDPTKLRLGTNENPNPIPKNIAKEIGDEVAKQIENVNRYPQDQMVDLRKTVSEYIKNTTGFVFDYPRIMCGNGSSEILYNLHIAFGGPGNKVLTFSPTYMMYPQYCRDSFTEFYQIPRNEDFSINVENAKKAIAELKPSLIVIANPNNPTGNYTSIDDLEEIVKFSESIEIENGSNPLVILDEAYIEFIKEEDSSAISLLNKYQNVAIIRTLSKAFSFAGVRFGYIVSTPKIIDAIRLVRLPYNVSTVTQSVVMTILPHYKEMLSKVQEIKDIRDELYTWLTERTFRDQKLIVIPSSSNFIQIGFSKNLNDYKELPTLATKYIYERGIIVRNVGQTGYFRVSIGYKEEVEKFKTLFREFLLENEQTSKDL